MSASFPYEQLIASKLEELPALPEMADAIWARITAELDADPGDDFGGDDFDGGPGGGFDGSPDGDFGNGPDGGVKPATAPAGRGPLSGVSGWYYLLLLGGIALFFLSKMYQPEIQSPEIDPPDMFKLPSNEELILPLGTGGSADGNPANNSSDGANIGSAGSDAAAGSSDIESGPGQNGLKEVDSIPTDNPVSGLNTGVQGVQGGQRDAQNAGGIPVRENEITPQITDPLLEQPQNESTGRSDNTRLDSVSTTPPSNNRQAGGRKRPTGIKGVNSTDYRIVPQKEKKDSI